MKVIVYKELFKYIKNEFPDIEIYGSVEECPDAEVIIGGRDLINPENLDKLQNVKWVQLFSAGYNHIDLDYLKCHKIILTNARGIYSIPIAEDVVCRILMHSINAFNYIDLKRNHSWNRELPRTEIFGQTIGIIGTGSIAKEVAMRLKSFGVKVVGYKRNYVENIPFFDEIYIGDELKYVLSVSDYIVVTVDLNNETHHMLNKDNMKYMKKDASIINIARGKIINQQDLVDMLRNKEISYAGLDVFETEPLPKDDELWDLDNVYITPHISCMSNNNNERFKNLLIENFKRYLKNETLLNVVKLT
jgi:phosphoglycerate dehydrogenase-like enzyme